MNRGNREKDKVGKFERLSTRKPYVHSHTTGSYFNCFYECKTVFRRTATSRGFLLCLPMFPCNTRGLLIVGFFFTRNRAFLPTISINLVKIPVEVKKLGRVKGWRLPKASSIRGRFGISSYRALKLNVPPPLTPWPQHWNEMVSTSLALLKFSRDKMGLLEGGNII